jgi:hypothetical protein
MPLAENTVKSLAIATTDIAKGNEIANSVNNSEAFRLQSGSVVAALIIATAVSPTTDFGALRVGDRVLMIPAVAGNAALFTVATLGTLPAAAVVGNAYLVLRAFVAPATSAVKF